MAIIRKKDRNKGHIRTEKDKELLND